MILHLPPSHVLDVLHSTCKVSLIRHFIIHTASHTSSLLWSLSPVLQRRWRRWCVLTLPGRCLDLETGSRGGHRGRDKYNVCISDMMPRAVHMMLTSCTHSETKTFSNSCPYASPAACVWASECTLLRADTTSGATSAGVSVE